MEKVIIFQTYYKPEQFEEYHLDKLPSFVKVVNTVSDDYPLRELNPFWSEFIYMKFVYEHLDEYDCEYIGFDQYKRHFDYNTMNKLIESSQDICILGDLGAISVYPQYCNDHKKKDIDNTIKILKGTKFGSQVASHWTAGVQPFFFGSCFIVKKEAFKGICEFIFSVIGDLDKLYGLSYDVKKYEDYFKSEAQKSYEFGNGRTEKTYEYQRRVFGYLSERLLSSWIILNYYFSRRLYKINLINEKERRTV